MKKIKSSRRLSLNVETLCTLQLTEVSGGGTIVVPSKPQASCFIVCLPTNGCPLTPACPVISANC